MSNTKHTPTPWELSGICVIGADLLLVCDVATDNRSLEADEANAAFIVRAVNSHEQLVAALKEMTEEYRLLLQDTLQSQHHRLINDGPTMRKALAALAAAEA